MRPSLADALKGLRTKSSQIAAGRKAGYSTTEIAAHLGLGVDYVAKVAGERTTGVGAPQPAMPKLPGRAPPTPPAPPAPGTEAGDLHAVYRGLSTATITTVLLKKGLRNVWLRGSLPLVGVGAERIVGEAFTLRFVPAREDLATPESWASPISTRAAIEAMPAGVICVADAMGVTDAGIFGDILCQRMKERGVAALVTDGVVRDLAGVESTGLPVFARGAAAPPSVAGLTFVGWNEPIACGGVAVFPGDLIVADRDGAVVVPKALVAAVADAGVEQERFEGWVHARVREGAVLPGLYPPNAETKAAYEAWKAGGAG